MKFSVLMSVYEKENPFYLDASLRSVFDQTLSPDEVVIVEDGPLTDELSAILSAYKKQYSVIKIVKLKKIWVLELRSMKA